MVTRRHFVKLCTSTVLALNAYEFVAQLTSEASSREIPVLIYHRVGYTAGHLTVAPERLAQDLQDLIDNGYQPVGLPAFEKFLLDGNVQLPERPVLITFDDGYADNFEYAYPLLKKYKMTAVFYIITAMIGQPDRLTVGQIREMAAGGMHFGSHTISHRSLGDLPESEIRDELQTSKNILETILDRDIRTIAYPKGSYNSETLRIAREIGYVGGFTTRYGKCGRWSDHFVLKRIPVFSFDYDLLTVIAKRSRSEA